MGRSPPIGGATPSPLPATPGQAEPAPSTTAEAEELADELGVFFALGPSLDAGDEVARQLKMRQGAMNELVSTETRCVPRPACAQPSMRPFGCKTQASTKSAALTALPTLPPLPGFCSDAC